MPIKCNHHNKNTTTPSSQNNWGRRYEPNKKIILGLPHESFSSNHCYPMSCRQVRFKAFISFPIISIQVFLGLPRPLLTKIFFHFSILLTGASLGLRRICPNHRKRFSLLLFSMDEMPTFLRISSFQILCFIVFPHIH